jgi:Zn-dependent peptidase ImmA (M78 family)
MSHLTRITTAGLLARSGQGEPPISVHAIAADMDVTIERAWLPLSQPGFTALIRSRWFIWVNAQHSPRRRRFTTGHELGHIAMNHQGIVFFFDCGEPRHMQTSANRFSAELLMPEDLVYQEHARAIEAGLSVGDLADIFLVDKRVAELRLEELSLEL